MNNKDNSTTKDTQTIEGCLDILGEPINTGDYVIFSMAKHRTLYKAKVIGWTAKRMRISYLDKNNNAASETKGSLLDHHSTRFVKISKLLMMRIKMGLDLSNGNPENVAL